MAFKDLAEQMLVLQRKIGDLRKTVATTVIAGLVKLASNTQTLTGTADDIAVTPAGLRSIRATQAQVDAGIDSERYVTPATLDGLLSGENKELWSGVYYMSNTQTVTFSEAISEQKNGIVLVWSRYGSGAAHNDTWSYLFIPKWHVQSYPGAGILHIRAAGVTTEIYQKYVYVSDGSMVGHAHNATAPQNTSVLRAVLGV